MFAQNFCGENRCRSDGFKMYFSGLSKRKSSTWSPEALPGNQYLNNESITNNFAGIVQCISSSRKIVDQIFFLVTNSFLLTLLLTKSKLLFYAQVPNGLHNYNSDTLKRKWLRSAEGINNIKKNFFENDLIKYYVIVREIMNSSWMTKCLIAL